MSDCRLVVTESARSFAGKCGISEDLCTAFSCGPMVLSVFVEFSCGRGLRCFSHIISSILCWMRRSSLTLWDLSAFLLSESLARVFSLHGIHFLPIRRVRADALSRNDISGTGICKLFGARNFIPLLSVDFSALPLYFKSLHLAMAFGSQHLPDVLAKYLELRTNLSMIDRYEENDSHVLAETGSSGTESTVSVIPAVKRNESPATETNQRVVRNAVIVHGLRLQKHQRKRSSLKYSRNHLVDSHAVTPCKDQKIQNSVSNVRVSSAASACSQLNYCFGDSYNIMEEDNTLSPFGSQQKHRKSSRKSFVDGTKELKVALAEVKQNIDLARCNVNLLVTDSDRCWREEGAEVMLEFSGSQEWCIAVKAQGTTRYVHKPQDMRPCVVNRFTHAYMWSSEDGWKLEFCDKWDWLVFKELHLECRDRNTLDVPVKIIPVPGVQEVSGYDEIATASFMRPDMYIRMIDDEVGRALRNEVVNYDMDSGDEEWLCQKNSSSFGAESNVCLHVSENNFEKIIFALEKDAYINPDDISDKERALTLCQDLGMADIAEAVYDYWLKKRNKRRAPLVRVFQGQSSKRAQLIQKPFYRKKRSFNRQRSQTGRGKQGFHLQAEAKQEFMREKEEFVRRIQEAESAANIAVESAIDLRSRAQMLMVNAELAAYKAVMSLRIAESKWVSESPELASSILD